MPQRDMLPSFHQGWGRVGDGQGRGGEGRGGEGRGGIRVSRLLE